MILEMSTNSDDGYTQGVLQDALKKFKSSTKAPETYLRVQNLKKIEKNKQLVKELYDYAKSKENKTIGHVPSELVIDDMDEEQIWQQLELQNDYARSVSLRDIAKLLQKKDEDFVIPYKTADQDDEENKEMSEYEENEDLYTEEQSDIEDDQSESDIGENKKITTKKLGKTSVLDDQFFKLSEMEAFLEDEDKKEMNKHSSKRFQSNEDHDEVIDYFKSDSDDDDENADNYYKYGEFFDRDDEEETEEDERLRRQKNRDLKNKRKLKEKKNDLGLEDSEIDEEENDVEEEEEQDEDDMKDGQGKVKFNLSKNSYRSDSDVDEDDQESEKDYNPHDTLQPPEDEEEKSTYEHREERLRLRIQDLENQALSEKAWQLKGEIDSTSRPQNSLLEEILEFDATTRPAPIITEETTLQLEDIIKQRIKDKSWNDVERKYKPENAPQEFRKKLVLDQEKSKESLAQIYEKEYLKEIEKLDPNAADKDEEEPKEHKEIRAMMKSLFLKLDALSNFYYTPKPVVPDVKIITNIPAINMEEVAPIAVSDAQLLAPEEIKSRPKGDVLGKSERTKTDKNRERRQKKVDQKVKKLAKEKRDIERQKMGKAITDKQEKKKLLEKVTKSRNVQKMKESVDGKSIKSSKQFFSQLQDEVTLNGKKSKGKRSNKIDANQANAKRFKL